MPNPFETSQPGETPATGDAAPARRARAKMTPESTLRTALLAFAGLNGLAGLFMFLFPRALWVTIGGAAELYSGAYASTRFAGGMMVALAVGALLVLRRPEGSSTVFTVLALQATLVAVGTLATIFADDAPTGVWFEWLLAIVSIALAGFMWWARIVGRKTMKEG